MSSDDDNIAISSIQLRRLRILIENAQSRENFEAIDEFSRNRRDYWTTTNRNGKLNDELVANVKLIFYRLESTEIIDDFSLWKLVSTVSNLIDCSSTATIFENGDGDFDMKRCLISVWQRLAAAIEDGGDDRSKQQDDDDSDRSSLEEWNRLDAQYGTLDIFTIRLASKFRFDLDTIAGEFTNSIINILHRACNAGKTKIVAQICSPLFSCILDRAVDEMDIDELIERMLDVLGDDQSGGVEGLSSTMESRCVGVHCLISARIAGDRRSIAEDSMEPIPTTPFVLVNSKVDARLIELTRRYLILHELFVRKCGRSILSMILGWRKEKSNRGDPDFVRVESTFGDFIKLMEALELKQLHVVKPAFGLLDSLIDYCQKDQSNESMEALRFDSKWLRSAFFNALHHVNAYVVKWAIGKYFELDPRASKEIVGERDCEFLFGVILPVLERSDAYYRFAEENTLERFIDCLERFLRGVIDAWTPEIFWRKWLDMMNGHRGAPVALFYLTHILSIISNGVDQPKVFDASDLETFRSIFYEFRQIPLLFIRAAVQEATLKIFFNLLRWDESTILAACSRVLTVLPCRVVWPERAVRFVQDGNDFSWATKPEFLVDTIAMTSCLFRTNASTSTDDCVEIIHGLRMRLIVVKAIFSTNPTALEAMMRSLANGLCSTMERRTMNGIEGICAYLLLVTIWMEQEMGDIWSVIKGLDPQILGRVFELILSRMDSTEESRFVELTAYLNFISSVFESDRIAAKNTVATVLTKLRLIFHERKDGDIRKYFIMKIYSKLLEYLPADGAWKTVWFLARAVLDENGSLINPGKRYGSSEWNRILSEYAASKWRSLSIVFETKSAGELEQSELTELTQRAVDDLDVVSGAESIHCVMECVGFLLPMIASNEPALTTSIVKKMLAVCYEQRKSDQFVPTVRRCCPAVIQLQIVFSGHEDVLKALGKVVERFLTEAENPSLACCVAEAVDLTVVGWSGTINNEDGGLSKGEKFMLETVVELCCSGNLLRKDQRMVYDASEMIKGFGSDQYQCVETIESDHQASQKTRSYAFHAALTILEKSKNENRSAIVDYFVELACAKLTDLTCGATKTGYFANSQCHRIRTRSVQLLLLIEPSIKDKIQIARRLQQFTLRYLVEQNQQPSVRLLLEWLMSRLNLHFDGLLDDWWNAEAYMIEKRVGTLCTWMQVLMHTGLCLGDAQDRRGHALECVRRWLPWCTAQNFTLRCCAQTCLRRLWLIEKDSKDTTDDESWKLLQPFIEPIIFFDKEQRNNMKNVEKASKDFYFALFNAQRDYTLQTILHTFPRLCFLPLDELIPIDTWRMFDKDDEKTLSGIPIENPTDELAKGNVFVWRDKTDETLAEEIGQVASYESLQTKTNLFAGDSDIADEFLDNLRLAPSADGGGLILAASLVDRPTNLGGLCRTCEIFGVTEYAISTYRVAEDFQFQVLSVSSERWVKMVEVKVAMLKEYLTRKQSEGYTVVAVEQTTTSRRLTEYRFPAKTLLLLGNEKEGIPVDLLQCVDVCVEIPQLGHTRSLNVHVAGALLIWEYTKQRRFSK